MPNADVVLRAWYAFIVVRTVIIPFLRGGSEGRQFLKVTQLVSIRGRMQVQGYE